MTTQLSRTDLATMTPAEIEKARQEGRLTKILGGSDDEVEAVEIGNTDRSLTRGDVDTLTRAGRHDLITEALTDGRLNDLIN